MSKEEQIINKLREKTVKLELKDSPTTYTKIDKKALWVKAKKAAEGIRDDDLPAANPAAA